MVKLPQEQVEKDFAGFSNPYLALVQRWMNLTEMVNENGMIPGYGYYLKVQDNKAYLISHDSKRCHAISSLDTLEFFFDGLEVTELSPTTITLSNVSNDSTSIYSLNHLLSQLSHGRIGMGDSDKTPTVRCKTVLVRGNSWDAWTHCPRVYVNNSLKLNFGVPQVPEGATTCVPDGGVLLSVETDLATEAGEAGITIRKLDMKVVRDGRVEYNESMAGFTGMYKMGVFKSMGWPSREEYLQAIKYTYDDIVERKDWWWYSLIYNYSPGHGMRVVPNSNEKYYLAPYWGNKEYQFDNDPQKYVDALWRKNKEEVYAKIGAEKGVVVSVEEYNNRGRKNDD